MSFPDDVELLGTMRTLSAKARRAMGEAFERIITKVAEAHGAPPARGSRKDIRRPSTIRERSRWSATLAIEQFGD